MGAMRIRPDFSKMLLDYEREALETDPAVIVGLCEKLNIAYTNDAWDSFAQDNGGDSSNWSIGFPYLSAVPTLLRSYYADLFEQAQHTREPIAHVYECSSPLLQRRFQMRIIPLRPGGFLVSHSLVFEEAHPGPEHGPELSRYRSPETTLVVMCVHCCRTRRPQTDWVPAYVASQPEDTSHGMCQLCLAHYYS